MKKAILVVLVIAQVMLVCLSSGCADISEESTRPVDQRMNLTDYLNTQPLDSVNEDSSITEFWQAFRSNNPDRDLTVDLVYSFAVSLWDSGIRVLIDHNLYIDHFLKYHWIDYSKFIKGSSCVEFKPGVEKDKEKEVYLLFIATITNCLTDCYYDRDLDFYPQHMFSLNRPRDSRVYVYFSDDITKVKEAIILLQTKDYQPEDLNDDYLNISFEGYYIYRVNDFSTNIYSSLKNRWLTQ